MNAEGPIRFCDEYEQLLEEFLHALTAWKQVCGSDRPEWPMETRGKIEMLLAEREYIQALSALQVHSRECMRCEEKLRVYVNVHESNFSAAIWNMP